MLPHVVNTSNHYKVVESHDPGGNHTPLKLCLQRCATSIHHNWPIDDQLLTPHDRYSTGSCDH